MRVRRIWLAAILTFAAVVAPCLAWYVAGSRAADREASALRNRPYELGTKLAESLASRLAGRLEAIRDAETQRPHYHYQSSYHDPQSTCHCASMTPSPLSVGLNDALIEAHFQIDPFRDITLPTLHGDAWPRQVTRQWFDEQNALLARLERAAESCLQAVDAPTAAATEGELPRPESLQFHVDPADPELDLGEFEWFTAPVGGQATLTALRRVDSSRGSLVQGFLISRQAVTDWLRPTEFPVAFKPHDEGAPSDVAISVDIPGQPSEWSIALDVREATASAETQASAILAGFHRSFFIGSGAAALAGLTVVILLWQTDRLARQRARFAASAAHELRTPLASLRLYGDMISGNLGDPAKSQEYARRIADESERLGRVVTNVLGYTRLEHDSLTLKPEPGDLGLAVKESLRRLEPAIAAAGAKLALRVTESLPTARFDPESIAHVVQNLVDNAEKYSREVEDRTIEVSLTPSATGGVELAVSDRGPGVPPGIRSQLFRPFTRGSETNGPAGLGLGLSLVHSLLAAQGASIRYDLRPGGGSTFVASFQPA